MVSQISHKSVEAALRQLQAEKEERLKKLSADERKKLDDEEDRLKEELRAALEKKQKLAAELDKEEEDLKKLRQQVEEEAREAEEERRLFRLQQRIEEFRGNPTEELRERLIHEGFDPRLVDTTLRRRTLDESLDKPTSMRAKFTHLEDEVQPKRKDDSPFAAIYSGRANLEQLSDRRVLDHLYRIRQEQESRGYLAAQERNFLERFEYAASHVNNPEYQNTAAPQAEYFSRATNVAEFIKERDSMEQFMRSIGAASQDVTGFYKERERQTYQRRDEHPHDQH